MEVKTTADISKILLLFEIENEVISWFVREFFRFAFIIIRYN